MQRQAALNAVRDAWQGLPVVPVWHAGDAPLEAAPLRSLRFVPRMSGKMLTQLQQGVPFGGATPAVVASQIAEALKRARVTPTAIPVSAPPPVQVVIQAAADAASPGQRPQMAARFAD